MADKAGPECCLFEQSHFPFFPWVVAESKAKDPIMKSIRYLATVGYTISSILCTKKDIPSFDFSCQT